MKKILIATRNKDKFKIVSKLLKTNLFPDAEFYNISDINKEIIDEVEVGDINNRSKNKAVNIFNQLDENNYDFIIGVDDGIKMKGSLIPNVKDYIKDILDDKYLSAGEIVYIVRSYTFINKENKIKTIITEIPFEYSKLDHEYSLEKNSYPLSHVLKPLNLDVPVYKLTDDESNDYYSLYSKESYNEIKKFFNIN